MPALLFGNFRTQKNRQSARQENFTSSCFGDFCINVRHLVAKVLTDYCILWYSISAKYISNHKRMRIIQWNSGLSAPMETSMISGDVPSMLFCDLGCLVNIPTVFNINNGRRSAMQMKRPPKIRMHDSQAHNLLESYPNPKRRKWTVRAKNLKGGGALWAIQTARFLRLRFGNE